MSRAELGARLVSVALGLACFANCSGEKIRLGDAASGGASSAGMGGVFPASGGIRAGSAGSLGGGGNAGNGSNGGATGGAAGSAGAPCESGTVAADEVVWIGDSWVTLPGDQHNRVRDLARNAGAIAATEDYVILAEAAAGIDAIVQQYATQQAGPTKIKVLIMDGGTWDTLTAGATDASVNKVVTTFKQFLTTVANDGSVEHIVYYLMPENPLIAGVAALRPQLVQACSESKVPCHFLDLQPLWVNHPEYSDGIQASKAGAIVIANEIWKIMQDNCIAQ